MCGFGLAHLLERGANFGGNSRDVLTSRHPVDLEHVRTERTFLEVVHPERDDVLFREAVGANPSASALDELLQLVPDLMVVMGHGHVVTSFRDR